jgi:hypothetical protein
MVKPIEIEALKAARRNSREEEIRLYGKPICWTNIVRNRKAYNRKSKHKQQYE